MKKCILLMGLPCSGKSTWIEEQQFAGKLIKDSIMVSADNIKTLHKDYNPQNVTKEVHEWSVKQAEDIIKVESQVGSNLIIDSGSINNRYTLRIIDTLKKANYRIKLVHVKTPYEVCLERNKKRERKVPEKDITDKALKEVSQFYKIKNVVDEVEVVDYFTNKHIFVDMDGVIAAQSTLPIINGKIDFTNGEIHKWQKPVEPVIKALEKLENFNDSTLYILSATANSVAYDEKNEWLDKHFNVDKHKRFFVNQGRHKAEMLSNLIRKFKLNPKDVTLIDDTHSTLYDARSYGANALHPSELLVL